MHGPLRSAISSADLEHVTAHIAPLMEHWRGARILITGATGFFGQWMIQTFHHANQTLNLGAKLVGVGAPWDDFSRLCPHLIGLDDIQMVRADICQLEAALRGQLACFDRIDAIVHTAIYVDSKTFADAPIPTLETGVKGTWEALQMAKRCSAKRFLFVSSGAVYGKQPTSVERMDEHQRSDIDCTDPLSAYSEGKRFAETLACGFMRQYALPVMIARPFAFVGPHLPIDRHFAIGNFIRDALANTPIIIQGDGTPERSYLYAADLAIWLWTILTNGRPGQAYNVGSEEAHNLLTVASLVSEASEGHPPVIVMGAHSCTLPSRYVPDTSKALQELGLKPSISLVEGIRRTLDWHGTRV